jgi:hypothetical protein
MKGGRCATGVDWGQGAGAKKGPVLVSAGTVFLVVPESLDGKFTIPIDCNRRPTIRELFRRHHD